LVSKRDLIRGIDFSKLSKEEIYQKLKKAKQKKWQRYSIDRYLAKENPGRKERPKEETGLTDIGKILRLTGEK